MNLHHKNLLKEIEQKSGKPTQHTFSDSYLGNDHPRYPISAPLLRTIAKDWMKANRDEISLAQFTALLTSLIKGKSATEKSMAGILLDYAPAPLRKFDPALFDSWLEHLKGWAEVDVLCTGAYSATEVADNFTKWKKLMVSFSKSKNIEKRRASIVLLCSPLIKTKDNRLVEIAFENIDRLKSEKEILITKAISWVLRSAVKHYKKEVQNFVTLNMDSLPKIALRETLVKLKTGKKTKSKTAQS